jgi:hypothetical protein
MELYFYGYCPESLLQGKQVEMRLNEDDFWESEATNLQITVFPPYATILRWRGSGKFKQSSEVASNSLVGLILTKAQREDGKELFPDVGGVINDNFDLEWYLGEIFDSKKEYDDNKFNLSDPIFKEQEEYLTNISSDELLTLIHLSEKLKEQGYNGNFMESETFFQLHELLYELKLIFNFKWMAWYKGLKNIHDTNFDYSKCSLLELSMYLTAIFRADRFNDGTIENNFNNGTLTKIFSSLIRQTHLGYS